MCIIIPVYNHEHAIGKVVSALLEQVDNSILLVNDGSSTECTQVLRTLEQQSNRVLLLELPVNQGKGAAVKAGLRKAKAIGFIYGLQLDADGQHSIADIQRFVTLSQIHPEAMICGYPIYDNSVPRHRYYLRYLTHIWIWINTLSFTIKDSMCGFRIYPLQKSVALIDSQFTGSRMDFDPEFVVRWVWQGHKLVNVGTNVSYPIDGVSHFDLIKDNVLITKMHTRLFFGMLWRLPNILFKKLKKGFYG